MDEDSQLDSYLEDLQELGQAVETDTEDADYADEHDGEHGFPYNAWDLSDDAHALASAGWGEDEMYGGYEE